MRLVFAGTASFAVPALEALVEAGHEIVLVITQPDRPAGRGRRPRSSPVKDAAATRGLPLSTPERLGPDVEAMLRALAPDALVVVAYGRLVPPPVLQIPCHGALNIHPSLLPRWRGAAPVERALLAGDIETGVAVMRMDSGLDTGPVLRVARTVIEPEETAGELSQRLASRGAQLLVATLQDLEEGRAHAKVQKGDATYAARLSSAEARLDFTLSAESLARRVRAFNPRPGAWAECAGERVRILRARPLSAVSPEAEPGVITAAGEDGIDVATGAGVLRIRELQRPGGRAQPAAESVRGREWCGLRFS